MRNGVSPVFDRVVVGAGDDERGVADLTRSINTDIIKQAIKSYLRIRSLAMYMRVSNQREKTHEFHFGSPQETSRESQGCSVRRACQDMRAILRRAAFSRHKP